MSSIKSDTENVKSNLKINSNREENKLISNSLQTLNQK